MGRRGPAAGQGGRPSKPLADKVLEGNPGKRKLIVVEFPHSAGLKGIEKPLPRVLLSARQKDGRVLEAAVIFAATWTWHLLNMVQSILPRSVGLVIFLHNLCAQFLDNTCLSSCGLRKKFEDCSKNARIVIMVM